MSGPAGSSQWIYTRKFDILNSARFNKDDSAFLEKTGSAGNRRTFTLSLWFKTHGRGVFQRILESGANTQNQCLLTIDNGDKVKNAKNIEVLPISSLMGEAIKRISNSTSVSDLFK